MDISSFLNRKTFVDSTFKTNDLTIIFNGYKKHMISLMQNILFRLETTGRNNKIIILTNDSESQDISEMVSEFVGFFSTEILILKLTNPYIIQSENIIILNDLYVNSNPLLDISKLEFTPNAKILALTTSYSGVESKIVLSNVKKNNIKQQIYFDNLALVSKLDNSEFDFSLYGIIESKIFNILNQILTESLPIYQTIELINLETLESVNGYKFKDISRTEKYFDTNTTFSDDIDSELIINEVNPYILLGINMEDVSLEVQATDREKDLLFDIFAVEKQNIESELNSIERYLNIYSMNSSQFSEKIESLNQTKESLIVKKENLEKVGNLFNEISCNSAQITNNDVLEIGNIIRTLINE